MIISKRMGIVEKMLLGVVLLLAAPLAVARSVDLNETFEESYARTEGSVLVVGTGAVERRWWIGEEGLKTVGLKELRSGRDWATNSTEPPCDWDFDGLGEGKLVSIRAAEDDDDKFAAPHLKVSALFRYERMEVTYVVWAYPGACGLRTQVELKNTGGPMTGKNFERHQTDALSFASSFDSLTAFGYMQGIKTDMKTSILREETLPWKDQTLDWANGVILSGKGGGVIAVKESNKHTGIGKTQNELTGVFRVEGNRLAMTGAGFAPSALGKGVVACWANWIILYSGDGTDARLALKRFDRTRYPVRPERDIYMMANTWGSEDARDECLHAAREENVLKELESIADLGIDVLQIDDGWQRGDWTPAASAKEVQHKGKIVEKFGDFPVYPEGFGKVRARADELGVNLGLWAAWTIPLNRLVESYDTGNFKYFKLDFVNLKDKVAADALLGKARYLVKHSGYSARVNWDVTEKSPRMGYLFGRECSNIYLSNRKTSTARPNVQYIPFKVLRDAWLLAEYLNLNQYQVTVANIDFLPEKGFPPSLLSYEHDYVVAISLMSSPIFFQETHHYKPEARALVKSVLKVYKEHRQEMYQGFVFPIGDIPTDSSWTGFQNHNPESGVGYLTVFREAGNEKNSHTFNLHFLKNQSITLTDLMSGETLSARVGGKGQCSFSLEKPGRFRFFQYGVD